MFGAGDDLDLTALPPAYQAAFAAQQAALSGEQAARARLEAEVGALTEQKQRLEHLVREFRQALYGKRSEKLDADARQLAFEDLETALAEVEEAKARSTERSAPPVAPSGPTARRNLGRLPQELPRLEQVIEPTSLACPCGCGAMARIGEDVTERLDIVPAQFRVIATIRPKYACPTCQEGVHQAPALAHLIEGGLPTEATLAHVLVGKFADHLPLYRQAQIYSRQGIDLDRSTLAGWVGKAAFHLEPVVDRLAEHLRSSSKLFMDETPVPVLDPGRGRTKTGYLWVLARDDRGWCGNDPPGIVYHYAPGRSGKHAEQLLQGFDGILQVDGYGGYNRLTKAERQGGAPLVLAHCWTHARRQLKEIFDRDGSTIAAEGLAQIAALYRIEAEIRGRSSAERLAIRKTRSAPLVDAFGQWLRAQRARVSRKSRIGEKLTYIANQWDGLLVFLTDGRVEIDSNAIENAIRPVALTRKNALFAGHDEGGRSWGRIASLIATAKMNGIDPFAYLKATLEALANGHPKSRIDDLMPWAFK